MFNNIIRGIVIEKQKLKLDLNVQIAGYVMLLKVTKGLKNT